MTEIIRLYRGDSTKIPEFDIKKARTYCLVGRGIYLTDNPRIASTYKTKGTNNHLFNCVVTVKTKNDVIPAVIPHFFDFLRYYGGPAEKWNYHVPQKKFKELKPSELEDLRQKMMELVERELLIIRRVKQEGDLWVFDVSEDKSGIGWVSVFEFPEPEFTQNCINLDADKKDLGLLDLLDDKRFWTVQTIEQAARRYSDSAIGLTISRRQKRPSTSGRKMSSGLDSHEGYMQARLNVGNNIGAIHFSSLDFKKLISALKPYGIHGFEYNGGVRLGGYGRHRAFSIWNDDYVNDHKVRRYK